MMNLLHDFHFLRPWWLLALLPLALLLWWHQRRQQASGVWQRVIDAALLQHLVDNIQQQATRKAWGALAFAWLASCIALAGPTWQRLPQPVLQQQDALVIVLDLTLSMYARDEVPSRLVHAQRKLRDLLALRKEGVTALVAYSGDAHTVTPLTDDTATIGAMVSALAPDLMPVFGSNAASGIETALGLLDQAGVRTGRILLMTDEVLDDDAQRIASLLQSRDFALLVLGIGTPEGAPIAKPDGGFLKRNDGSIIVARLNSDALADLAVQLRGRYIDSRVDDSDINYLLAGASTNTTEDTRETERKFDVWADAGHYFVWLPLLLALYSFRRGVIVGFAALLLLPAPSHAASWHDWWQRPDQQAAGAMQQHRYEEAANKFSDPAWRAAAQYRAGNYQQAADTLKDLDDAQSNYNRANALAKAGKLEDAIAAYDRALAQNPNNEDAKINRQLAKQALEQQQQQQRQNDQQNDSGEQQDDGDKTQTGASQQPDSQQQNAQQQNSQQQDAQQQAQNSSSTDQQPSSQQQGDQSQQPAASDTSTSPSEKQQATDHTAATPDTEDDARQKNREQQQAAQAGPDDKQRQQDEAALQQAMAQQQQQREQEDSHQAQTPTQASIAPQTPAQTEQQQALEQWLRRVPDDPGGLMRNKFNYQYRLNQREGKHIQEQEQVW